MPHFPESACQQQGPALRGRCLAKGLFPCCREPPQAGEDALPQGQQFQRPGKVMSGEVFFPLGSDPLPGHSCRLPGEFLARPEGGLLHPKPQFRGKPGTPQDAQGVLPEPPVGVSHTAQQTGGKICLSAEGVPEFAPAAQGHGVHCEIPPGQILPEVGHKPHRFGVAVIPVLAVSAEGGHLQDTALGHHSDGAVFAPVLHQPVGHLREGEGGMIGPVGGCPH